MLAHMLTQTDGMPNVTCIIEDIGEKTKLVEELNSKDSIKRTKISHLYGVLFLS